MSFSLKSISFSLFVHVLSWQQPKIVATHSFTVDSTLVVANRLARAMNMGTPLQSLLMTRWEMVNYRYNEVRVFQLTTERLALHDLFFGRTTWVVRSENGNSSSKVGEYETSSVSIETILAEPTEATRSTNWHRTGLEGFCHCGRCNLRWFQYGWECWPARS